MAAVKVARVKKQYTDEEKALYKEERIAEQKQLLEDAVSELTSSEGWTNWIKFGRNNLGRLSFNNALLIWAQRKDAKVVWGAKQWEKKGVTVNPDAQKLRYLAPAGFFTLKDANGQPLLNPNGTERKLPYYRVVTGYDVADTNAPEVEAQPMVELDGDEMFDPFHAKLEGFARSLGVMVFYRALGGNTHGYYDEKNAEIVIKADLSGNAIVRTLIHELAHAYGNVNYTDYSREEAEVIVESATVMTLGMLGYDVSAASVPYIADWSNGDLKTIEKYAKLVEELVKKFTQELDV